MPKPKKAKDIDAYISQFPADVQAILEKVRATIARYAGPKGNLQFPLDEPIPYDLI